MKIVIFRFCLDLKLICAVDKVNLRYPSNEMTSVARKQRKHRHILFQLPSVFRFGQGNTLSKSDLVAIKYTEEILSELMRTASPTLAKKGECMYVSNCSKGYISTQRIPVPMVFN